MEVWERDRRKRKYKNGRGTRRKEKKGGGRREKEEVGSIVKGKK